MPFVSLLLPPEVSLKAPVPKIAEAVESLIYLAFYSTSPGTPGILLGRGK